MDRIKLKSNSPAGTLNLGKRLGRALETGSVIALTGELGCGKTLFTRGVCSGLGINDRYVNSPTFVLVNEYRGGRMPVYHMDLYRLEDPGDVLDIGLLDYFNRGTEGLIIVEWAERINTLLPEEHLKVEFAVVSDKERDILFSGKGYKHTHLLEALRR